MLQYKANAVFSNCIGMFTKLVTALRRAEEKRGDNELRRLNAFVPCPSRVKDEALEVVLPDAEKKLKIIRGIIKKILDEIGDDDPIKFARAYSPGLQEYVEAESFYYYLRTGKVGQQRSIECTL